MIDSAIQLYCTDNNKTVTAHVLSFKEKVFLNVAVNTVNIRLNYMNNAYAGSMAGMEFVIKESQLPTEPTYYQR
jgi:hypothetical protein